MTIKTEEWEKYMLHYVDTVAMTAPHKEMRKRIAARIHRHAGGRNIKVLDAGCAAGALLDDIVAVHDGGMHYIGFDQHEKIVALARERHSLDSSAKFRVRDMNQGFGDERDADIVVWSLSAYCMQSFEKAIQDSHTALKLGGVLIMVNPWNPDANPILAAHAEWMKHDASPVERKYFADRQDSVMHVMAFNKRIAEEAAAERYHFLKEGPQRELVESCGFRVETTTPDELEHTSVMLVARKIDRGKGEGHE